MTKSLGQIAYEADPLSTNLPIPLWRELSLISQNAYQTMAQAVAAHVRAEDAAVPVGTLIAGALFDFLGMLTSQDKVTTFSSRHDAGPAVEQIKQFAKKRGLLLDGAEVENWIKGLAATEQPVGREDALDKFLPHGAAHFLPPMTVSRSQLIHALENTTDAQLVDFQVLLDGADVDGAEVPAGLYCWDHHHRDEGMIYLPAQPKQLKGQE